jgi:hypothetical protein
MQREPISQLCRSLLDDPCHFVRRACQVADYGDPAQGGQPALVSSPVPEATVELPRVTPAAVLPVTP